MEIPSKYINYHGCIICNQEIAKYYKKWENGRRVYYMICPRCGEHGVSPTKEVFKIVKSLKWFKDEKEK